MIRKEKKNCIAYKQLERQYDMTKGKQNTIPDPDWTKWQMDKSEFFTVVNVEESKKVARSCVAELKQCYINCWRALTPFRYRYFEGFVTGTIEGSALSRIPLEHSWLVNEKNEVVDPTLILDTNMKRKIIFNEERLVNNNYLGIEIPVKFALRMGFKIELSGPYLAEYYMEKSK